MAFEQSLDADRVDGFNIFSAFVRVPLLVLGGILGADGSASANAMGSDSLMGPCHGKSIDDDENDSTTPTNNLDEHSRGEAMDCTKLLNQQEMTNAASADIGPLERDTTDVRQENSLNNTEIKQTKNLSWSDESGLPLVYENDESVLHHDPNSNPYASATAKPTKSAMRKSRSIRHVAGRLAHQERITPAGTSRYIPNMKPRATGNGLIMPTRPYGGHPSVDNKANGTNGAEMSPQWGWYINTTPPTPELYYKHSASCSTAVRKQVSEKAVPTASGITDGKPCQNRVFQDLQNSTKTNPMGGWTSIPI
ncbi:unnamed protein product [Pseudo-nitzschia multistriata]|uniref:Uncharacterized protein n=1 Tax=Pseudo-nitzschia multistriata TaxID=183589 RepID=A0A448ZD44_9STRA|nr:unnamed protein product [Pseudo-nitzschia multistriata]